MVVVLIGLHVKTSSKMNSIFYRTSSWKYGHHVDDKNSISGNPHQSSSGR